MNNRKIVLVLIAITGTAALLAQNNVGIGTTTPQQTLHLNNNLVSTGLLITTANTGTTTNDGFLIGIRYQQNGAPENTFNFLMGNENIPTYFFTNKLLHMQISAAGNVGIGGFFQPTALLHTRGTGAGQGNVLFEGQSKANAGDPPAIGAGTRMMWYPDKAAFRAGRVTGSQWDIGNIGSFSNAWGDNTTASGTLATAWGNATMASGLDATAWGYNTTASGDHSTAWGLSIIANSFLETALGHYSTTYIPQSAIDWNTNDRLFVIGNGTSSINRSNALTVMKNGNVGIMVSHPNTRLHVNAPTGEDALKIQINNNTKLLISSNGGVSIGTGNFPDAALHVRHNNISNEGIRIQNLGANARHWTLHANNGAGTLILYSSINGSTPVGNFNGSTGAYSATSNRHLKTNVLLLGADVLTKIQQLQPATYSYLRDPLHQRTVGFMAEDVQPIFPELVDTVGENGENMAINYAGFSVVAIKAIQLLHDKLEEKEKRIETLEAEIKEIKKWMMDKQ